MARPDYIFGQFQETARCRDAQHGGGICCASHHSLYYCYNTCTNKNSNVRSRCGPGNAHSISYSPSVATCRFSVFCYLT